MSKYNVVMETNNSTVVTEYEPLKRKSDSYQSEAALEKEFIRMLQEQGYDYLEIHDADTIIKNLRNQLELLYTYNFSDPEWERFFNNCIANKNDGIVEKTRKIQEDHVQVLKKDKNSCLINLYNLYSQIPSYMEILSTDDYTTNLYSTKMELLNAYSLANSNKWIEITSSIKSAEEKFEKIVNSAKNEKEKNNLEKIYTMIKNLENTVALNNKNIFYMQYKNVIQEISNL